MIDDANAAVPAPRVAAVAGWRRWARRGPAAASGLLCLALAACYATRPDAGAAVTVVPPWAWLVPGLGLLAVDLRGRAGRRRGWPAVGLWLAFVLATADEPRGLGRGLARAIPAMAPEAPAGEAVRVVTLNCAIGNRLAADEVAAHRPDVVLLQESPGRVEVERLAARLFGPGAGVVYGVDASLIARGRAEPADLPAGLRAYFVQARVTLASGRAIEVFSLRLVPAVFRLDLWSPECWREQAANRRKRRAQLAAIAARAGAAPAPAVIGGDFNAPAGDAVFRLLGPGLRDAFADAGVGWGDTVLNEFPVLRIDQVWASRHFHARSAVARRTRHSDHRMVVVDLVLPPG